MTRAVPTDVAGALRSSAIPPMETGRALTLNAIWICASMMIIMGSQEADTPSAPAAVDSARVVTTRSIRFHAVVLAHLGGPRPAHDHRAHASLLGATSHLHGSPYPHRMRN